MPKSGVEDPATSSREFCRLPYEHCWPTSLLSVVARFAVQHMYDAIRESVPATTVSRLCLNESVSAVPGKHLPATVAAWDSDFVAALASESPEQVAD